MKLYPEPIYFSYCNSNIYTPREIDSWTKNKKDVKLIISEWREKFSIEMSIRIYKISVIYVNRNKLRDYIASVLFGIN